MGICGTPTQLESAYRRQIPLGQVGKLSFCGSGVTEADWPLQPLGR